MAVCKILPHVFGIRPQLPLDGFPVGAKIRIRLRNNEFATAFVRTPDSLSRHYIFEQDSNWCMGRKSGSNIKIG